MDTVTSSDQPPQHAGDASPHRSEHAPPPLSWHIGIGLLTAVQYVLYSLPLVGLGIATDWTFRLYMHSGSTCLILMYIAFCLWMSWGAETPTREELRDVVIRTALLLVWIPIALYHHGRLTWQLVELNRLQPSAVVSEAGSPFVWKTDASEIRPGELYVNAWGELLLKLADDSIPTDSSDLSIHQRAVLMGRAQRWVDERLAALRAAGALTPEEKTAQDIARYVE